MKNLQTANKTSNGYKNAKKAFENPNIKVYTCHTSGSGRFTSNIDSTADTIAILKGENVEFEIGNDSPRGGKTGNFVIVKK